jgi:hypothetical protein
VLQVEPTPFHAPQSMGLATDGDIANSSIEVRIAPHGFNPTSSPE